ncbi:phosphatase PAP2 family protein [Leucobacter massiliensis]|uniref:Phosphatidic acid phosphatase type 2/haloperoxidase domain-containing protein n=1 Tax=Leucobacter massiliensis TaxID=1686285 RepID=A0A2S9QKY3_9MICO|nr:phosphatase PAP2 family protein [Leucobacter massiliensis]PRI10251.1 hypothetical protein B4915_12680 [Leucobacter massiliensis]
MQSPRPARVPVVPLGAALLALLVLLIPLSSESLSVVVTRAAMRAGFGVPGATVISDLALLLLAVGTAASLAWAWIRRPATRVVLAAAALGVGIAYVLSESAKLVFQQLRPCGRWEGVGSCELADYSFPSNHATLAFGAVFVIALAVGGFWATAGALVVALLTAVGRLLEGAHYLHDVAAGAVLGTAVPALLVGAVLLIARRRQRKDPLRMEGVCRGDGGI